MQIFKSYVNAISEIPAPTTVRSTTHFLTVSPKKKGKKISMNKHFCKLEL